MRKWSDLRDILYEILGSKNVYYQPPSTIRMKYPCIRFERDYQDIKHADNNPYRHLNRYSVTVITTDIESDIPDKVSHLQTARYDREYNSDGLHHTVYTIYF